MFGFESEYIPLRVKIRYSRQLNIKLSLIDFPALGFERLVNSSLIIFCDCVNWKTPTYLLVHFDHDFGLIKLDLLWSKGERNLKCAQGWNVHLCIFIIICVFSQ